MRRQHRIGRVCASGSWRLPAAAQDEGAPVRGRSRSAIPDDQFWRGFNLLHGRGVDPDPAQSTQWFQRAAEQGHMRSQVHVGMAYLDGARCRRSITAQAFEWLLKAADQGHPKAQLEVGILYMEGRGVRRDRVEGAKWLLLSVYAGGPMARVQGCRSTSRAVFRGRNTGRLRHGRAPGASNAGCRSPSPKSS